MYLSTLPAFLGEASQVAGAAALAADTRKHMANGKKCQELGFACVPIAMETYGDWGREAKYTLSHLNSGYWFLTTQVHGFQTVWKPWTWVVRNQ